jgi:hypothetical protein
MIRKDANTYLLSTGREILAHHGLIGIAHQAGGDFYADVGVEGSRVQWGEATCGLFEVSEGYGGHLGGEFTAAEKIELAEFMSAQWQAFRKMVVAERSIVRRRVTAMETEPVAATLVRARLECGHEATFGFADHPIPPMKGQRGGLPEVDDEVVCEECSVDGVKR